MRFVRIALAALVASACAGPALAQDAYPTKSVTLVVPFPPGGGTDTGARIVAEKLGKRWGQTVVVDNKPAAPRGRSARSSSPSAKPDGYTILMGNDRHAGDQPVAVQEDERSTRRPRTRRSSLVAELPLAMMVNSRACRRSHRRSSSTLAKSKPGKLSYSSAGDGGATASGRGDVRSGHRHLASCTCRTAAAARPSPDLHRRTRAAVRS